MTERRGTVGSKRFKYKQDSIPFVHKFYVRRLLTFSSDNPWWWFSFFAEDRKLGDRLLGVAVAQARDMKIAKVVLKRSGIRLSGKVVCMQIPAELGVPPESCRERLLDRDEARALADLLEARRPMQQNSDVKLASGGVLHY